VRRITLVMLTTLLIGTGGAAVHAEETAPGSGDLTLPVEEPGSPLVTATAPAPRPQPTIADTRPPVVATTAPSPAAEPSAPVAPPVVQDPAPPVEAPEPAEEPVEPQPVVAPVEERVTPTPAPTPTPRRTRPAAAPATTMTSPAVRSEEHHRKPEPAETVAEGSPLLVQALTVAGLLGAGFLYFRMLRSRGPLMRRSPDGRP